MPVRVITPPAEEPVSQQQAKEHLRLEEWDADYVALLITAARQYVEKVCWRRLVTQTVELVLPGFVAGDRLELAGVSPPPADCGRHIELPGGVLASVTSVKYRDTAGVEQTLASSTYSVDSASVPGRLYLAPGKAWPQTQERWDAVVIRCVVGEAVSAVPRPIKQAMLLLISQMYENRTPEVTGASVAAIQFSFDALLAPYRLSRIG